MLINKLALFASIYEESTAAPAPATISFKKEKVIDDKDTLRIYG
jgi:hypothetical protein